MRKTFCKKIQMEYLYFKETTLKQSREEIFADSYRIDVFTNLYELLVGLSENLPEDLLKKLLCTENLLDSLYEDWLKKEDSSHMELTEFVMEKVKSAAGSGP